MPRNLKATLRAGGVAVAVLVLARPATQAARSLASSRPAVASFGFDEDEGAFASDREGAARAELRGAAWTSGGRSGGALSFDGTGAIAVVPALARLRRSEGATLEAWIQPVGGVDAGQPILELADGFALATRGPADAPADVWTHLAATFDGATARLYVNGQLVETRPADPAASGGRFLIGASSRGTAFNGRIDEVRVYDRALDAAEIAADMASPVTPAPPDAPRLVITSPSPDASVSGSRLGVTYSVVGAASGPVRARLRLDEGWERTDATPDGAFDLDGVAASRHLLSGYLVDANNARIPGSDAVPVAFETVPDPLETPAAATEPRAGEAMVPAAPGEQTALVDPAVVGQWAGPFSWPLVSVHTTLLPNGKVLLYDDHTDSAGVQVWDPIANTLASKPYNANNLFCSAHLVLPNGKVLVAGGHVSTYVGLDTGTFFDPTPQTWSAAASMSFGRWYPTETILPSGKILVTSGATNCPTCSNPSGSHAGIALIPEVYDTPNNTWSQLPAASLSLPLYPHMFVLPNGKLLATGSQEDPIATRQLDLSTQLWSVVDPVVRDGGSSVMYRPGKVLKTGSARNPDYSPASSAPTAWVLDMTGGPSSWRGVQSMSFARTQHTLTMLPDGNVLVTGGGGTSDVFNTALAVKAAEVWSPTSETWTTLASMSEPRLYHSTALLLPDARVLVSGGGRFGPDFPSAELFSPPYLFKGPRPTITSAPSVIQYNSNFGVGTPSPASIAKVTLLGIGAVTHAFNMNQRYLELTFQQSGGLLDVSAPANANLAPPGYYMLFLVDTNGIPSIASMLRIPGPWEDAIPPTAPSSLSATPAPGKVDLSWTAATDNNGVALYNVHRATAPNVTPTIANRVGQTAGLTFQDTGFATGTYYYVVTAQDAGGNIGPKSNEVPVAAVQDSVPPTVAITAPGSGAIITGVLTVTASASDDIGVVGVQFLLDGQPLGAEDLAPPYATDWNSALSSNGPHTLAARARDARGNLTTSVTVPVTASNSGLQGLVLSYGFDENAGTLVHDSSGNVNRGTISGATWTAQGHTGTGLSFDGASDWVEAPNSASVNVAGNGLTIETWANITTGGVSDYVLIAKPWTAGTTGTPPYQYGLEFDNNGAKTLDFYFGDTNNTTRGPYSMTPVTGTWTHVAFTFDGLTVKGYLDGALKVSIPAEAGIASRNTPFIVGADGGHGQSFKGRLDDVKIYNRALSAAEILQDMNAPVPPPVPPVPDGTTGTAMRADRVSSTAINLTWDASSCTAKGYHTVYGPLASVSTYLVSGGVCGMGTSGSFSWTSVPASDLWFVVVADDAASTEGFWGAATSGPMNATTASAVCGMTGRVNLQSCP